MKTRIKFLMMCIILLTMMISACKKDDNNNETEQEAPAWLIPFQGNYSGTYDGDDSGSWTFSIANSPLFIMTVESDNNNTSYSRLLTLDQSGAFSFSDQEIILLGNITPDGEVTGTWQELVDITNGNLQGSKEPQSTDMLVEKIFDIDGELNQIHEYDTEGRHIKTTYFHDNSISHYRIRTWGNDAFNLTDYDDDNSVRFAYKNPLPFNNQGLSEYATFIMHSSTYTRYDTINYNYNADGTLAKATKSVAKIYSDKQTETGTETITYTYSSGNPTQIAIEYNVGPEFYTSTYNYTYYSEHPDYRNNLAPFLGRTNINLAKRMEAYSSKFNDYTIEFFYDLFSNGMLQVEYGQTTTVNSVIEFRNSYFYK